MNEATGQSVPEGAVTAGRLLREARQAQGLHLAALASAIKVAPRKLESLEADRLDELPDATFTRALAQTVCRTLKVDAAPILALLPRSTGHRLEQVGEGLNTPFRERPSHLVQSDLSGISRPALWAPLLLLFAAAVVYLIPAGWLSGLRPSPAESAAASAPSSVANTSVTPLAAELGADSARVAAAAAPSDVASGPALLESAEASASAPVPAGVVAANGAAEPAAAAPPEAASAPATTPGLLRLHARADSWIEVLDARGQSLLARTVRAGETVDLDGTAPMRLKIGNARDTEIVFRGRALELAPFTRDNLARLELK